MIEIDTGIYYDPNLGWFDQTEPCQAKGQAVMLTPPVDSESEPCSDGGSRMIWGIWHKTTATGSFEMRVDRKYVYGPNSPAFLSKEFQDHVTVKKLN